MPGPQVEEGEGGEDAVGGDEDVGSGPPELVEQIRQEAVTGPDEIRSEIQIKTL